MDDMEDRFYGTIKERVGLRPPFSTLIKNVFAEKMGCFLPQGKKVGCYNAWEALDKRSLHSTKGIQGLLGRCQRPLSDVGTCFQRCFLSFISFRKSCFIS